MTGFERDGSGAVTSGPDERRPDRVSSRSWSRSAPGSRRSGRCSTCRRRSTSTGPTAASRPGSRCGPTGTCRRARSRSTRRSSSPTTARCRPSSTWTATRRSRRRRQADHRRALGHLRQARPRQSSRAEPPPIEVGDRASSSSPTRPAPSSRASPTSGAPRSSHCMERFDDCRACTYRHVRSGGAGAFTADNFPVFDYMRRQRLRRRRLQPRLQDDRRRPRDRPGAAPASTRPCCTRSASSASRPATCTRSRSSPYPWS